MEHNYFGRVLTSSLCSLVLMLQVPTAHALTYFDDFNSNLIDPTWWTVSATGTATISAMNGRVELSQGASPDDYSAMVFTVPIIGDFTVTIDYTLLNWPINNKERLTLNAYAGPNAQLAMERVSDRVYDPGQIGEVYLTDFTGQGILGTSTTDTSGTLRLARNGDIVQGSFWSGSGWNVIGTYTVPGENSVSRLIGIGMGAVAPVTPGVRVAVDNFALNAPSVPAIPEPETYSMLLGGLAVLGYMTCKRRLLRQSS